MKEIECIKQEQGYTLIEIMASIVILSIVSLTLTTFFVQALSYAKGNQNKTIMVNLARNALFYIQKEPFKEMQDYFVLGNDLNSDNCKNTASSPGSTNDSSITNNTIICSYQAARDTTSLAAVLNPEVNGIGYYVKIQYEQQLLDKMSNAASPLPSSLAKPGDIAKYFLPVKVTVTSSTAQASSKREQTEVEGYILDESIR